MRDDRFVKTENVTRFFAGLDRLQERGAEECCWMVMDGPPGTGKTETVDWAATQHGWIMIRAKREWSISWIYEDLLAALEKPPERSKKAMFKQIKAALSDRNREAKKADETFAVVVDEVDHIARQEKLLDSFRDFSDDINIPFIFVGMDRVWNSLSRYPQILSRASAHVEYKQLPAGDIRKLVTDLCEVPVSDDLTEFLAGACEGYLREAKDGIKTIERFGERNRGATVDCRAMAGQTLFHSRKSGKPVMVKVS